MACLDSSSSLFQVVARKFMYVCSACLMFCLCSISCSHAPMFLSFAIAHDLSHDHKNQLPTRLLHPYRVTRFSITSLRKEFPSWRLQLSTFKHNPVQSIIRHVIVLPHCFFFCEVDLVIYHLALLVYILGFRRKCKTCLLSEKQNQFAGKLTTVWGWGGGGKGFK